MISRVRIVLGNSSLVCYPEAGGLWLYIAQYSLGLRALGHDVLWLEVYQKCGVPSRDQFLIDSFLNRIREHGLETQTVLLLSEKGANSFDIETAEPCGKSRAELKDFISSADLLWNFAGALRRPLLSRFKRRVLLDGDPGHLQVSALQYELGQSSHEVFLTAGCKIHDPDCEVPTLGLKWHSFPQFVYLPLWTVSPDPGPEAPFTSVTQWNWEELWWNERALSIAKREAYVRWVELPQRAGRPFQLAANIHPSDPAADRALLLRHGWTVVDPHVVAGTPAAYQEYIRSSRAEICCPKPIYRELRTGWFSDRSACYLAGGRPVLAEDTGFGDHFPTGRGLLVFKDLESAAAGVAEIDANYATHSRAAREFAEAYLDSRRCLTTMLEACELR